MNTELLQQQVDRGSEAEMFLRYLENDGKYFLQILKECEEELANDILRLSPHDIDEFATKQAQRLSLYEPLKRIQSDKAMGELALKQLEGNTPKGIL